MPAESIATRSIAGDTSRAVPADSEERQASVAAVVPGQRQAPPAALQPALAAPRPLPPPTDDVAAAREAASRTLASYARALESSDLHALEWVYPHISDRERGAWKKFFGVARDLVVTLNIERMAVIGSEAHLDVRGNYRYWNRSLHRPEVAPVRFLATVRRDGDTWHLSSIR
jgi:hypothetical protein